VPRFPEKICNKLRNLLGTETGVILNNPVDLATEAYQIRIYNILSTLANYGEIDLGVVHFPLGLIGFSPSLRSRIWDSLIEDVIKVHKESAKPLIVVIHSLVSSADYQWMLEAQRKCSEAGIPVYHSISSAAKAIDRFIDYYERKVAMPQWD
jgi:acyl-CoA synthetase (NDP forming)